MTSEIHNSITVTLNLVVLVPTNSLRRVMSLLRVDEPAPEDPGVQKVETAEKELVEGKLCP
jgi:hypothetical protein